MDLADRHHLALATVSGDVDLYRAGPARGPAEGCGGPPRNRPAERPAAPQAPAAGRAGPTELARAFGYLGDTHQPDPQTAPLVREAYAAVLAGSSLKDIMRTGTRPARMANGNPWTRPQVSQFLRAPRNAACAPTAARSSARAPGRRWSTRTPGGPLRPCLTGRTRRP